MTVEIISAIGENIVFPICFFGFMAWAVYLKSKD